MASIACLADCLVPLFTTTADALARESGCVQRERILTGSRFAQTLVFGSLSCPDATLSQLQQTLAATGPHSVSRQALAQHCTEAAATFLRTVLEQAATLLLSGDPVAIPLLHRFTAVLLLDSTTIALPAALAAQWPGCGGRTPTAGLAALKVQLRLDLLRGGLDGFELQAGRVHDARGHVQTAPVPLGALRLADLGYFALAVLAQIVADGGHFLCRPKLQTRLVDAAGRCATVAQYLAHSRQGRVERTVLLGVRARIPCRLLAQRLPPQVAAQRLARLEAAAQREGQRLSADQRTLAHWIVLVTSLAAGELAFGEALVLYRLRWQVELLFKLWRSAGVGVAAWRTRQPWRVLCTLYAKLLACLVQHWLLVASCWVYADKSLVQAAQTIRSRAAPLLDALHEGAAALLRQVQRLAAIIATGCKLGRRRGRPPSYHRLLLLTEAALS
jgi:Transposase DDE domain